MHHNRRNKPIKSAVGTLQLASFHSLFNGFRETEACVSSRKTQEGLGWVCALLDDLIHDQIFYIFNRIKLKTQKSLKAFSSVLTVWSGSGHGAGLFLKHPLKRKRKQQYLASPFPAHPCGDSTQAVKLYDPECEEIRRPV